DCGGYDTVMILVDRFGKRLISIPCPKTITAKEAACLYIQYPTRFMDHQTPSYQIADHSLYQHFGMNSPASKELSLSCLLPTTHKLMARQKSRTNTLTRNYSPLLITSRIPGQNFCL